KGDCYVGNALHIKLSLGIAREKNDKVDAIRLARFAWKNRDELRLNIQSRFIISHLKELSTLRKRLIGVKLIMKDPLSEQSAFLEQGSFTVCVEKCERTIGAIEADLAGL